MILLLNAALMHANPIAQIVLGFSRSRNAGGMSWRMIEPERCACGSLFAVARVEGHSDKVIPMRRADGRTVDCSRRTYDVIEECMESRPFQLRRNRSRHAEPAHRYEARY